VTEVGGNVVCLLIHRPYLYIFIILISRGSLLSVRVRLCLTTPKTPKESSEICLYSLGLVRINVLMRFPIYLEFITGLGDSLKSRSLNGMTQYSNLIYHL